MKNPFLIHPNEVGETYFEHFKNASTISIRFGVAALMQFLHAVFPFIKPPLKSDLHSISLFIDRYSPDSRKNDR